VILVACKKNITTEATAKLFFERVWVHLGIPQTIVLDWDSQFLSTFWHSSRPRAGFSHEGRARARSKPRRGFFVTVPFLVNANGRAKAIDREPKRRWLCVRFG
jgi:hypothetical protein